jgi:hypothetical protein
MQFIEEMKQRDVVGFVISRRTFTNDGPDDFQGSAPTLVACYFVIERYLPSSVGTVTSRAFVVGETMVKLPEVIDEVTSVVLEVGEMVVRLLPANRKPPTRACPAGETMFKDSIFDELLKTSCPCV